MEKEIYGAENITCPRCKKVTHSDSWEINSDDGEDTCDNCGANYTWTRDTTVTYNSELKESPTSIGEVEGGK